jgi:hypothetical protein
MLLQSLFLPNDVFWNHEPLQKHSPINMNKMN